MGKRVYICGAGFSKYAGFPLQNEILKKISKFEIEELLDVPRASIERWGNAHRELLTFFELVSSDGQEVSLEDLFTLLDHSISKREIFQGFSWAELEKFSEALKTCIIFVLHEAHSKIKREKKKFYEDLAAFFVEARLNAKTQEQKISFISLNWDSLLEDSIYDFLRRIEGFGKVDIDYCFYTTPLGNDCPHTPSIFQKPKGIFNIKVLKLHGSTNWLYCPNCNRVFTGLGSGEIAWDQYTSPKPCPKCEEKGHYQKKKELEERELKNESSSHSNAEEERFKLIEDDGKIRKHIVEVEKASIITHK